MSLEKIEELAKLALEESLVPELMRYVREKNGFTALGITEPTSNKMESEALDAVYRGDCDEVIFAQYRNCRNLDNALRTWFNAEA
jgi:hypothetical protein